MKNNTNDFNFKSLLVWQKAVDFAKKIILLIDQLNTDRKHYKLIENLESAAISVPDNIAEGKGRYSKKEFKQFLYISRGSLFEIVSKLYLFEKLNWITSNELIAFETEATEIAKMLNGLISSINPNK